MAPLESRREPGTVDPTATESGQITSEKQTPTKSSDPDSSTHADDPKKTINRKYRKKHPAKGKKAKLPQKPEAETDSEASSEGDSDEEDSDSESEVEVKKLKRLSKTVSDSRRSKKDLRKKRKAKAGKPLSSESDSDESDSSEAEEDKAHVDDASGDEDKGQKEQQGKKDLDLQQLQQLVQLMLQTQQRALAPNPTGLAPAGAGMALNPDPSHLQAAMQAPLMQQLLNAQLGKVLQNSGGQAGQSKNQRRERRGQQEKSGTRNVDGSRKSKTTEKAAEKVPGNGLEFKRVDQVWDSSIHNYKLKDTTGAPAVAQYEGFIFHIRRTFDWEGKYKTTYVDVKSKDLRECLREVIGNIKGVSLVEETPKLNPNLLFLYLEDLRKHLKVLKKTKPSGSSKKDRKRDEKRIEMKRRHLKVLVKYLDQDYAEVKRSLYPMLENGLITFDLLWALWKPGTLVYTETYGCHDEPRAFKVGMSEKHYSMMRGDFYWVEGKYFEYDGKQFGYGTTSMEIPDFQGARKITSLQCYPLKYHKNEVKLRETLVERGKKFVQLSGVHYKGHQGMAFYKKKKAIVKVNINGRVMVDPSIHRRINPNYQVSMVRPKDHETGEEGEESESEGSVFECFSGTEGDEESGSEDSYRYVTRLVKGKDGEFRLTKLLREDTEGGTGQKLDNVARKDGETDEKDDAESSEGAEDAEAAGRVFSEEEYLISSPVVLGFAFSEKLWLEFTVSGIKEIQWNEGAYESLVLQPKTKDIVKALVESHKYHAAESIDDVIQGKGKGLVAVLHGPPGTGKTLTAEGISELLKCPLYMASAGELGTDSRLLEGELQKILDICHAWGAILLLDEADVFLEKRNMHDIHRNALVSIFLRQLEYFQGILFLTTNRVETFDDAFQSRIHIALRYDPLDARAKRAIFRIFVERVRLLETTSSSASVTQLTDEDYNDLARHDLNGRQIKNTVRTAQALAVNRGETLGMRHIRQVLDVHVSFERDLKGGVGYQEAMRSYF